MKGFLHWYEIWIVETLGYNIAVHFEDTSLVLAGVCIGIFIMGLLSGNFIRKLYTLEDAGRSKVNLIRVTKDGKSRFYVSYKSFAEAVEQVFLLAFSPFFTIKQFTRRDEKRTRRFLILISIVAIFLIAIAIMCIVTVFKPIA